MDRTVILEDVEQRSDLDSEATAERATVATLRTFGEHVTAGQAEQIADSLPPEIGDALTSRTDENPDAFDVEQFTERVAEREGTDVDRDEATRHVRAVFATLADEGLHNELQEAREQLPDEFATLFETDESSGE